MNVSSGKHSSLSNGHSNSDPRYGRRLAPLVAEEFASEDPNHIVGKIVKSSASPNAPLEFTDLTISQLCNAVNYMSHRIENVVKSNGASSGDAIGFIGLQDFRYWVMELAAMKTGHPLLIPSPRNAIPNNASLFKSAKCRILFYSGAGTPIADAAKALQTVIPDLGIVEIPSMEDMTPHKSEHYPYTKTYEEAKDDVIIINHTSGSTASPKPVFFTNAFFNCVDADHLLPPVQGRTLADLSTIGRAGDLTFAPFPFFHLTGIGCGALMLFYRITVIVGPSNAPPSGRMTCEIAKSVKLKVMLMFPSMCDSIIEYGEEIKVSLSELIFMVWIGGPLTHATGEWITQSLPHVNLCQFYATTETFLLPLIVPPKTHLQYLEFHPDLTPKFERVSADSDLYELVIHRHPNPEYPRHHAIFNIFPDHQEWRTKDLFSRCNEPGRENLWKFEERLDDMIILNTNLKVNPLHVEMAVSSHPSLNGCLVFGDRYNTCGLLLEPKGRSANLEELVETVWPSIEHANSMVPTHARISKNKIIVSAPDKPFARAAKGTIVRKMTIKAYETEIASLYAKGA